ncbi:NACHT, LRR and PYD domains-containing protein 3-like [Gastrophryne carolinensis]
MAVSFSSSGSPRDLIVFSLEDLSGYDFKKLKNKLSDFSYGDIRPIPRGRLENADCVTTKDLLVDTYGEEDAMDVITQVLNLIGLMGPASDLQERRARAGGAFPTRKGTRTVPQVGFKEDLNSVRDLTELRKQHMESVKEKFQRVKEHNARMGEAVSLQERYTPLLMREGHPDREDKEHELLQKDRRHIQTMEGKSTAEYSPTTLQTLFDPQKDGAIPKVVVLHGPAGIGKTWTSRKIMLDWASGNFYQDKFDFAFYLSCRELNTITGKMSLVRLLSRTHSLSSGDLETILKDSRNHGRLLFVIDGFDEFQWTLEEEVEAALDLSRETHKETLLGSLLRKQVLRQSSLLITTRSLAQKKLETFLDDPRYVEVTGFSGKDWRKYFYHSFEDESDAEKALRVIEENYILFIMCTVPILCWIVCTVLRQGMKKGLDFLQYKTTTSIYLLYLKGLLIYHGRNQPVRACLRKLCSLANEGVLNQKILFQEKDLERHGLSVSEVESVFLNENIFHVSIISQTCYSFIHLSVQEFLAALYYVLDDEEEASVVTGEAPLPEICKGGSLPELCDKHPHLSLAVRFLLGILYEKQLQELSEISGCKISLRARAAVEEWLTGDTARSAVGGWITLNNSSRSSFDVISCLYETQDEDVIRRSLPCSSCLPLDDIWPHARHNKSHKKQLCYCLALCECPLTLSINWDKIYCPGQETHSLLHQCQQLQFYLNHFFERSTRNPSKGSLAPRAAYGNIEFSDPAGLSWLNNPESKIQQLSLRKCHLSPLCCDVLASVLLTNRSLTRLDLSENHLEDSGVTRLCKGLRDSRCPLQELSLSLCDLSPLCCDVLASALLTNKSLIKLDLSQNNLEDSGVTRLCEGLRDPRCHLQELSLQKCGLSPLCCDVSALLTNRSLTKLDLSQNHLEDSGVTRLCEGLRDPRCPLQELRLQKCGLTHLCCDVLGSALLTNPSLIKLDLSQNHLEDSGVTRLCQGLGHPCFSLQELSLQKCDLSSVSCDVIGSALLTNRSLTKLDLSENCLKYAGERRLCKGLRNRRCPLQELSLRKCELSIMCCDFLGFALLTNQSLIKLDLSDNKLEDPGLRHLCVGLKDPDCHLQELSLRYCHLSPSSCDFLHSVLLTNRSLTKLDLSKNRLEDSGVTRLCEGLRDPRCPLQELRLFECGATVSSCDVLQSVITTNTTLTFLETSLDTGESRTHEEDNQCLELRHLGWTVDEW